MTESKQNSSPESSPEKNTAKSDVDSKVLPEQKTTTTTQKPTPTKKEPQLTTDKASPSSSTKPTNAEKTPPKAVVKKHENKLSKLAILAIIIAILACASCTALYYWFNQQQQKISLTLQQNNQQKLASLEKSTQQALAAQQRQITEQLASQLKIARNSIEQKNASVITKVETAVARLSEVQPTDWLVHEAEYLIRIAGRSLWLERNPSAAITLLQDASNRLQQLNDPSFLPVRESIHQDIEQLESLPTLETEHVILTLMGLTKQSSELVFKLAYIPNDINPTKDLTLSKESSWENIKKSWRQFMADFITVKHRTGKAEPLLSPKQQQNLTSNLQLKIQQAQWAASKENKTLFKASLNDITDWLSTYYDMDESSNQTFNKSMTQLKKAVIEVKYPNQLNSLAILRAKIKNQTSNNSFSRPTPSSPNKNNATPKLKELSEVEVIL